MRQRRTEDPRRPPCPARPQRPETPQRHARHTELHPNPEARTGRVGSAPQDRFYPAPRSGSVCYAFPASTVSARSAHRPAAWRTQRRTVAGCTPPARRPPGPAGQPQPAQPHGPAPPAHTATPPAPTAAPPWRGPVGPTRRQPATPPRARDRGWRQASRAPRRSLRPARVQADDQPPHRPAGSDTWASARGDGPDGRANGPSRSRQGGQREHSCRGRDSRSGC